MNTKNRERNRKGSGSKAVPFHLEYLLYISLHIAPPCLRNSATDLKPTPQLYIILIRPERNVRQSMMPVRYSTTKSSAVTGTNASSMMAAVTLTAATCDQNKAVTRHIAPTIDCSTQSERTSDPRVPHSTHLRYLRPTSSARLSGRHGRPPVPESRIHADATRRSLAKIEKPRAPVASHRGETALSPCTYERAHPGFGEPGTGRRGRRTGESVRRN